MMSIGVTPLIIHRPDTVKICGNETYTPSPSPDQFAKWSNAIHTEFFYYVLAQAILSILLLFVIVTSKSHLSSQS